MSTSALALTGSSKPSTELVPAKPSTAPAPAKPLTDTDTDNEEVITESDDPFAWYLTRNMLIAMFIFSLILTSLLGYSYYSLYELEKKQTPACPYHTCGTSTDDCKYEPFYIGPDGKRVCVSG